MPVSVQEKTAKTISVANFQDPIILRSGVQPGWNPIRFLVTSIRGSRIRVRRDPTRLLLALTFQEEVERGKELEHVADRLLGTGLGLEGFRDNVSRFREKINHTSTLFWVQAENGDKIGDQEIGKLLDKPNLTVEWIGPVYRLPKAEGRKGLFCPLPHVLIIKPAPQVDEQALAERLAKLNLRKAPDECQYCCEGYPYQYYKLEDPWKQTVYELPRHLLKEQLVREVYFENIYLLSSEAYIPKDKYYLRNGRYEGQWNMERIGAGAFPPDRHTAWDISTGDPHVVICIIDWGCDLTHPELKDRYYSNGINLGDPSLDGSASPSESHGTACAGIAAAIIDNDTGVAGLAGGCSILPLALERQSASQIANGIVYAATNNRARVISLSLSNDAWKNNPSDQTLIDAAISYAWTRGLVICVATHNDDNRNGIRYPATHPLVMACGASNQYDNRWSDPQRGLGSNYGPEMSVVAPGDDPLIPTTANVGWGGLDPGTGRTDRDYMWFGRTSAATPHVAGLAALLFSKYPNLTNKQVRAIIERTADKVGRDGQGQALVYADIPGKPNGRWNEQMGYGRINAYHALDFADVIIKDWPGDDTGEEPSTPQGGNFWDSSDIVVSVVPPNNNPRFQPDNPQSSILIPGQSNYLYIRVKNNGPAEARNVLVNALITGVQFAFPADWNDIDARLVIPNPITNNLGNIPEGGEAIATFEVTPAQLSDLVGWINEVPWWTRALGGSNQPCVLAEVTADNDYAYDRANRMGAGLVVRFNNVAQRNLVIQ